MSGSEQGAPSTWAAVRSALQQSVDQLPPVQREDVQTRAAAAHAALEAHRCASACEDDPVGELLHACAEGFAADATGLLAVLWLALAARLPSAAEVEDVIWQVHADLGDSAAQSLVEAVGELATHAHRYLLEPVPHEAVVIDVSHVMEFPWFLTGIQRVVRGVVAATRQRHVVQLVRVVGAGRLACVDLEDWDTALREAVEPGDAGPGTDPLAWSRERAIRLLLAARRPLAARIQDDPAFASSLPVSIGRKAARALIRGSGGAEPDVHRLALRRGGPLLLPELTADAAAIETFLRWRQQLQPGLSVIFYDAIPLTHAHYFVDGLVTGFAKFTRLLRVADHVLAISQDAATSARALVGLLGDVPDSVSAVLLPGAAIAGAPASSTLPRDPSLLLCVSSLEPRKNHVRLLRAVHLLRSRGHDVRLVLVGRPGWHNERIRKEIAVAQAAGVDVQLREAATDAELSELYDRARAVVFVSEVEGYGLPIVEALAHGTPVVCSSTGSMAEVAAAGGCLTVSPLDVEEIADGLAAVLTDDALHARLVAEAAARPVRTWEDYVSDLAATAAWAPAEAAAAPTLTG